MGGTTDTYWDSITDARDLAGLREAISLDKATTRPALAELSDLMNEIEHLQASPALDLLRWLGAEIAEAAGDAQEAAALQGRRLVFAAMSALQDGTKEEAALLLFESATGAMQSADPIDAVRSTLNPMVLLFRIGEFGSGLNLAEKLLDSVEPRIFETRPGRSAIYELAGITPKAPAGDRWANLLARVESGMRRVGDEPLAATTTCQLAGILVRSGAYEDAVEILVEAQHVLSRIAALEKGETRDVRETAAAHLWMARALDMRGSETEAETAYRSHPAFSISADPDNSEVSSRLLEHLIENERLQEALDTLESGEPRDAAYRPLWRALLSKVYALLNRPEAGCAMLHEAISLRDEDESPPAGASEFKRLSEAGLRDFEKHFEPSELAWRVHLTILEAATLLHQTTAQQIEAAGQALACARRFGDRAMESRCLAAQAEVQLGKGDASGAARLWEEALECELTPAITDGWRKWQKRTNEIPFPEQLRRERFRRSRITAGVGMQFQLSLGRSRVTLGEDSVEPLDRVIRAARKRNRRLTLYAALACKAAWLRSSGREAEARVQWNHAAGVLENLRADLSTIESQIGLLEDRETVYAELLAGAVETGDAELAMRLMERAKGRAFLEQILSGHPPESLTEEQEASAREFRPQLVRLLHRQTAGEMDDAGKLELQRVKNRLASLYRQNRRQTRPAAGAASGDAARMSGSGTAIVEYFVATQGTFVVVAHHGQLLAPVLLPVGREELKQKLETLEFELAVRERCWSLEALYEKLVAPIEALVHGASRLLIIPHDLLHRAPFHAFRSSDGSYLAQRFTVYYTPNLGVVQEAARRPWKEKVGPAILLAADKTTYTNLPPLSFAPAEATEVAKWLPGSRAFRAEQASRRSLLAQKEDCEILHCACHGEYDVDDALLSRLYLADGPLYGYEIERLPFRARIAVLSACESGVQKRLAGDETFGLVRALLSRGFEAVIASLWKVADESTAQLMGEFYRQRASGVRDAASALRNAQLQVLDSEKYAHPFYWAPYFAMAGGGADAGLSIEKRDQ